MRARGAVVVVVVVGCFRDTLVVNSQAWENMMDSWLALLVCVLQVTINRRSWGHHVSLSSCVWLVCGLGEKVGEEGRRR